MSEDELVLMAKYGITTEPKMVYFFNEHRYEFAKDAINYARSVAERTSDAIPAPEK